MDIIEKIARFSVELSTFDVCKAKVFNDKKGCYEFMFVVDLPGVPEGVYTPKETLAILERHCQITSECPHTRDLNILLGNVWEKCPKGCGGYIPDGYLSEGEL